MWVWDIWGVYPPSLLVFIWSSLKKKKLINSVKKNQACHQYVTSAFVSAQERMVTGSRNLQGLEESHLPQGFCITKYAELEGTHEGH